MKKRITKSHLDKLVEAQVRQLLSEGKKSEIEQSWNEYDKSSNKNINKAAKFSPVLAKDYNHNVEDGREESEKYCHGLEEKIRRMVEKRLNESANNYQEAVGHLTNAYRCIMQYNKQSIGVDGMANDSLQSIAKQIGNIIGQINRLNDPWDSEGQENLRQTGWA